MLFQKSLVFLGSTSFIYCIKDSKNLFFYLFFSLLNFLLQLQKVNRRALLFGSLANLFPRERTSFLSNRQSLDIHTVLGLAFLYFLFTLCFSILVLQLKEINLLQLVCRYHLYVDIICFAYQKISVIKAVII